jgi:hypothetical protein
VTNIYSSDYPNDEVGATHGAAGPDPLGRKRPKGPGMRVAALIAACAVVAGGAFAVTEALSGGGPSTPSAAATGSAATPATGLTGQAAVLNGALANVSLVSTGASASHETAATRQALRRLRRAIARLRVLGGIYGQYTFQTKDGPRTLAFERGAVSSVAGNDVTVRAADGTTWTWVLTGSSVVRQDGTRTPATALASGEQLFAAGSVSNGTRDAALIVIRLPASKPSSAAIK